MVFGNIGQHKHTNAKEKYYKIKLHFMCAIQTFCCFTLKIPVHLLKLLPAMRDTWVRFLDWEDPLEKEMAIHSSTLAWKIPWTEEPDRLRSMGSQRVGHD